VWRVTCKFRFQTSDVSLNHCPLLPQLLPQHMSMMRSVTSSPPACSQHSVSAEARGGGGAQTSLYSLAVAAAEEVQLPPRLHGSLVSSSEDLSLQEATAASSAPLYPNAFNLESEDDLQPRFSKDGRSNGGNSLSGSLTISKDFKRLAIPTGDVHEVLGESGSEKNPNCVSGALLPSSLATSLSSSTAAAAAAEAQAAIADFGVSFSWTRGEMIGRGGFGVV
jgi:hypothetical protein